MKKKFNYFFIKNTFLFCVLSLCFFTSLCQEVVLPGINQLEGLIPDLHGKKIGIVAHQASTLANSYKNQQLRLKKFLLLNMALEEKLMQEKK